MKCANFGYEGYFERQIMKNWPETNVMMYATV